MGFLGCFRKCGTTSAARRIPHGKVAFNINGLARFRRLCISFRRFVLRKNRFRNLMERKLKQLTRCECPIIRCFPAVVASKCVS
jgi:hypothetical protein